MPLYAPVTQVMVGTYKCAGTKDIIPETFFFWHEMIFHDAKHEKHSSIKK